MQCTREAKEQRAAAVLRNVRQFISGIKNFLVQHGEPTFDTALLDIRSKLKSNEFLNVDVVLELVLHQLVTLPLRCVENFQFQICHDIIFPENLIFNTLKS